MEQLADEGRPVVPLVDQDGVGSIVAFEKVDNDLVQLEHSTAGADLEELEHGREGLVRLAAEVVSATPERCVKSLTYCGPPSTWTLSRCFARGGGGWRTEFAVGEPVPERPEETPYNTDVGDGRVLVLLNPAVDRDVQLLRSFVSTLRHRREHDQLAGFGPSPW